MKYCALSTQNQLDAVHISWFSQAFYIGRYHSLILKYSLHVTSATFVAHKWAESVLSKPGLIMQ